jgi:hypothetical protein
MSQTFQTPWFDDINNIIKNTKCDVPHYAQPGASCHFLFCTTAIFPSALSSHFLSLSKKTSFHTKQWLLHILIFIFPYRRREDKTFRTKLYELFHEFNMLLIFSVNIFNEEYII